MKKRKNARQWVITALTVVMLFITACGSSGSDNSSLTPRDPIPDNNPSAGLVATDNVMIGEVTLPPLTAARPDAAEQAELDNGIAEVNRLRTGRGLQPFAYNESLAAYANVRAKEMAGMGELDKGHRRPDGTVAWDSRYFNGPGYAAEDAAAGNNNAKATVKQWENSPGHLAPILNQGNFNHSNVALGHYYDPKSKYKHYWSLIFSGDNTNSIYRYISPVDRNAALAAVRSATQYDGNGRLSVSNQTLALGQDHRITLRAPVISGWSYQTFGEITDTKGVPEAYLNVGKPFVPGNVNLQADYRGTMVGDLAQTSRVSADVAAHLDFGAKKTIALQIENASRGGVRDSRLDFSDTLNWNGNNQRFESQTGVARLYGPNAEELGGQFSRSVGSDAYRGVYGAKKVQ